MKKTVSILGAVMAVAGLLSLAACSFSSADEYTVEVSNKELVVFVAPDVSGNMSVKDYFDGLVEEGLITYTISDGMVTSVNGVENVSGANSGDYWMFYSDLTELEGVTYANPEWGTYEYEGKTLASCAYGVEAMPVVKGYTYAAVYQHTSW